MSKKLNLVILSSDYISQFWGRVVFDYSTLKFPERAALDYDHWDDEIIGYIENFKATDEAVTADAVLLDESPSDRATEVAYNLANGVPYEASALIDLESATETEVLNDAVETVNGRELRGPFTLYRGATLRGVAVCPHGADAKTRTSLALSKNTKGKLMALKTELNGDAVKLSAPVELSEKSAEPEKVVENDPPVEVVGEVVDIPEPENAVKLSEDGQTDGAAKLARRIDDELSAMVDEFGAEKGLEFYRRGLSFKDAKLENYSRRVAELESKNGALLQQVKDLETKVAELSAARRGDPLGVPESAPEREPKHDADPLVALAEKYKKNGARRLD